MKFTRYLLLFHFSRADRAVQIWMHFADNVDESKKHLPAWHMGSCRLERETDVGRQEEGRGSLDCTAPGTWMHGNISVCASVEGRVRQGAGRADGDTNENRGKNRVQERGTDGACAS